MFLCITFHSLSFCKSSPAQNAFFNANQTVKSWRCLWIQGLCWVCTQKSYEPSFFSWCLKSKHLLICNCLFTFCSHTLQLFFFFFQRQHAQDTWNLTDKFFVNFVVTTPSLFVYNCLFLFFMLQICQHSWQHHFRHGRHFVHYISTFSFVVVFSRQKSNSKEN